MFAGRASGCVCVYLPLNEKTSRHHYSIISPLFSAIASLTILFFLLFVSIASPGPAFAAAAVAAAGTKTDANSRTCEYASSENWCDGISLLQAPEPSSADHVTHRAQL